MTSARRAPELSAMRSMDSCWTMLLRPFDDLGHPPADRLRERPRLHDAHGVAGAGGALTLDVPRLHLLRPGHLLAVDGMGVAAHQRDRDCLGHLVAGHDARTGLAAGPARGLGLLLLSHCPR